MDSSSSPAAANQIRRDELSTRPRMHTRKVKVIKHRSPHQRQSTSTRERPQVPPPSPPPPPCNRETEQIISLLIGSKQVTSIIFRIYHSHNLIRPQCVDGGCQ